MDAKFSYKGFSGYIFDVDEDGYYGQVLNTGKDMVLFEGRDEEDLEKNFQTAVDNYIEICLSKRQKAFVGEKHG